jgi:hypothetical protein
MRDVDIHLADVVARARARLAALVRRPAEAAAYEAAVREAFRTGTTLEAPRLLAPAPTARPLAPAPTAESPASTSGAARPVTSVFAPTAPAAARPVASVSAPTTSAAEPAREPTAAEGPSPRHRRQAGETAPDYLLRAPTGGTAVADDFFDGLIRRVEGDR